MAYFIARVAGHISPDPPDSNPAVGRARVQVVLDAFDRAETPRLVVGVLCQGLIDMLMTLSLKLPFVLLMFELAAVVDREIDAEKYPLQRLR